MLLDFKKLLCLGQMFGLVVQVFKMLSKRSFESRCFRRVRLSFSGGRRARVAAPRGSTRRERDRTRVKKLEPRTVVRYAFDGCSKKPMKQMIGYNTTRFSTDRPAALSPDRPGTRISRRSDGSVPHLFGKRKENARRNGDESNTQCEQPPP